MPRYEFKEGKSSKFWEIELDDDTFTTRFGRIGAEGQESTKSFDSRAEAKRAYEKLVAEKVKKGYVLVSDGGGDAPPAGKENREIEARILEAPDDVQGYQVYADWLESQGDLRGKLIALQIAAADRPDPATAKAEKDIRLEHSEYLAGELAEHPDSVTITWRFGFFDTVRISLGYDDADSADIDELVGAALRHPSARFLRGLTVGMFDYEGENHYDRIVDVLVEAGPKPTLKRLFLGDFEYPDETEISWANVGDVGRLWSLYPNLEELELQGAEIGLGKVAAPKLRSLILRTGGLPTSALRALSKAELPSLEHLEIWTGDDNYGGDSAFEHLAPLLSGKTLPKLRHLGVVNCAYAGEVLAALASAPITGRLTSLDLSKGTLSDPELGPLFDHPEVFHRLSSIDLSENLLSGDACARLATYGAGKVTLKTGEQRQGYGDPDDRYVAVGE